MYFRNVRTHVESAVINLGNTIGNVDIVKFATIVKSETTYKCKTVGKCYCFEICTSGKALPLYSFEFGIEINCG